MKIIKRHTYKIKKDELVAVGLSDKFAREVVKYLNQYNKQRNYFYQIVSDGFEIRR